MRDSGNNIKDLILYILACYKIKTFIIIKRYYYVKMYFEILKCNKYFIPYKYLFNPCLCCKTRWQIF